MRNRIILFSLIALIWFAFKTVDYFFSVPQLLVLISAAVAIMLTHSLWLYSAQKRWRRKLSGPSEISSSQQDDWQPWVDILISAKNEARVIENTVRNFFKLDYEKFHLWIINDNSTDKTEEVLERLKSEFPRLRVLNRRAGCYPGKSAALNEALPLTRGEAIAVFDADAYVEPNFLKLVLPVLATDGVGAIQAQKRIYLQQKGFLINCQSSEYAVDSYFQMGRDLIGGAVELRGNGQVIKREALIDVGGWNNRAITDDLDLSMRLLINHWNIRFCPTVEVFEEGVTSLKALIRQRRRWAEGSIRRYLDYIFPLNSPTRLSIVERIDTLAFTVFFVIPALVFFEAVSEVIQFFIGIPTHGSFLLFLTLAIYTISQMNFLIAIRMYGPKVPFWKSFQLSVELGIYIYAHWLPCVFLALTQIIFGKNTSTWHPTEHVGHSVT
jgi:1,2-diacylglycerol 3-beta-glucosyltransferase